MGEMAEKASLADRRANALQGEMEEARALLDSADRGKRQTEAELNEARSAVNEMATINSRASGDKRRVEGARLADELRSEQDHTTTLSQAKRGMETQLGELEAGLADANESAMRGGKTAMAKLESRIRELEIELGNVQTRTGDNMKSYQKAERK